MSGQAGSIPAETHVACNPVADAAVTDMRPKACTQPPLHDDRAVSAALAYAAAAIARLDQALHNHPLVPAFLYRTRLEAVRRQSAVDGQAIDPWHLAALLEGLRLRMEHALRIIDRGAIFAAARHALQLHQWLVSPDFDQEAQIQQAATALTAVPRTPLLAAAHAAHTWLDAGGARAPLRAALVRHWTHHHLLLAPVPLTGAAALRPDTPWDITGWTAVFLTAVGHEAEDGLQVLLDLERAWLAARRAVAGRRRNSRAGAAVDILAAAPLLSATSLAAGLDMAVNNAAALLDEFRIAGIAVEVTHRAKRRLYGLAGLAPLRDGVAPPRRPQPGRGRGRPPTIAAEPVAPLVEFPVVPLSPVDRRAVDYTDLDLWLAHADHAVRHARQTLDSLTRGATLPRPAVALGSPTQLQPGPALPTSKWNDDQADEER